jgi:hypothetical protein
VSDPNIEGQIELTCALCGFRGTPLVAAAHDCDRGPNPYAPSTDPNSPYQLWASAPQYRYWKESER